MNTENTPQNGGKNSEGLTKKTVEALVKNYQQRVKILRKSGKWEDHDTEKDSKSIWFSKKTIDALFKANGCTDENGGLRIYFGMHDTDIMDTPYDNQLMTVLVATKTVNGVLTDQLFDNDASSNATTVKPEDSGNGGAPDPGTGVDAGKVCPPYC